MKTNTSITIYHKYYDSNTHIDKWQREVIPYTMFQGGKGARTDKGYENANDVDIFIPLMKNDLLMVNISIGDIVVKGTLTQEISKQSDLNVDNYNITTIIPNDYGTDYTKHIQLGAK